jgi:hypothetical protein
MFNRTSRHSASRPQSGHPAMYFSAAMKDDSYSSSRMYWRCTVKLSSIIRKAPSRAVRSGNQEQRTSTNMTGIACTVRRRRTRTTVSRRGSSFFSPVVGPAPAPVTFVAARAACADTTHRKVVEHVAPLARDTLIGVVFPVTGKAHWQVVVRVLGEPPNGVRL